jgi:hypothetical protein
MLDIVKFGEFATIVGSDELPEFLHRLVPEVPPI